MLLNVFGLFFFKFQYGIFSFKCSLSVVYFKVTFNYFYDLSFVSYRVGNKVFTEHYFNN